MQLSNYEILSIAARSKFSMWGFRFLWIFFLRENANLFNYSPRMTFTSSIDVSGRVGSCISCVVARFQLITKTFPRRNWQNELRSTFRSAILQHLRHRLGELVSVNSAVSSLKRHFSLFFFSHSIGDLSDSTFSRFEMTPTPLVTLFVARESRSERK